MSQRGSRPRKRRTFSHFHILGDVEQILKLFEVRVLVDCQDLSKIWSHMNRCLHWRRHKQSPDQYVGFVCLDLQKWYIWWNIHLLFMFLKTFSKYPELEICILVNSSFRLPKGWTSPLRRLFPAAGWVRIVLLPLLRIHCWCEHTHLLHAHFFCT